MCGWVGGDGLRQRLLLCVCVGGGGKQGGRQLLKEAALAVCLRLRHGGTAVGAGTYGPSCRHGHAPALCWHQRWLLVCERQLTSSSLMCVYASPPLLLLPPLPLHHCGCCSATSAAAGGGCTGCSPVEHHNLWSQCVHDCGTQCAGLLHGLVEVVQALLVQLLQQTAW
jgi:hypothetical protein